MRGSGKTTLAASKEPGITASTRVDISAGELRIRTLDQTASRLVERDKMGTKDRAM
jgi:hypothetical protein